jgi:ABC-2 type transport system ATP-binding protein
MGKAPGSLATPADQQVQLARDDTGPAARPGRREGGGLPLAVDLRGVRKSFGPVQAVRGVGLAVGAGEVMAILGLSRPDAGVVEVYGMTPRQAVRKGLAAAVMQTGGLLKDLTVAETVQYTAALFAVSRPAGEVLDRAGITAIAGRLVGKCSGGEQQRLRFAMALIPDPELLILDEPTQGMDVEGRRSFWTAIRQDAARGRTIIFATHYLEEADAYADRIVLIANGQIVADGTAAEVKGLASGRMIRATLPGADQTALRAMPGVDGVEIRGDTVLIHCGDSDAVARRLLNQTPARDLEITARGLEEAFLALTGDHAAGPSGRNQAAT